MQIATFSQEESMIHHCIQNMARQVLEGGNKQETVRLGLMLYKSCSGIFLKQRSVEKMVIWYCLSELYVKDVKKLQEEKDEKDEKTRSSYVQALLSANDNITLYLSQIFVRLLVLGLCIKSGENHRNQAKSKIKQLIKDLKIQLVVAGDKGLAETLIDELRVLKEDFGCVEFFEEVKSLLQKCDTFHVIEWIEGQLEEKRLMFQKKFEQLQKQETPKEEKIGKKVCIKKRVTVSNVETFFQSDEVVLKEAKDENKSALREGKQSQKENREESQSKEERKSLSQLAQKAKMSMSATHSSQKKPQTRFIYKSSKKQSQSELEACYEEQVSSPSRSRNPAPIQPQRSSTFSTRPPLIPTEEKQDSKTLCQETPPRPLRSAAKRLE